ncbi:MAG: ABC transporter ATP-binding protein/permease [Christensenellaceae bacterium]|jgi:ATP-binding cassette subfamily B protein|nr:ABC transporter ATP-binding protein/permease [Christensenellaceae bacterium]
MPRLRVIDDEVLERPFNAGQMMRIFTFLKPYRGAVAFACGLMVVAALASLAMPKIMSVAVDDITRQNIARLPLLIGAMALLSLVSAVCIRYRARILDTAGFKAIADLRQTLFNHVQDLPFSFFDSRSAGKIMVRIINDVNSLNGLLTDGIVNVVIDVITLVFLVAFMLATNWKLTLISFAILPFLLLLLFGLKRRIRVNWQNVRAKLSNMNGYLHESLAGMRVTQAFKREKVNGEIFTDTNQDIRSSWMRAIRLNNLFWPFLDIVSAVGTILVLVFGVKMLERYAGPGGITIGSLLAIIWYLGRFWEPLNNLSNFYNSLLTAMASAERIFEILDTPVTIKSEPGAPDLPPIQGEVRFEDVSFGYDSGRLVLKNVNFAIKPGQTVALVGPTGAGKSTVVNLLSRFYDVTGGAVRIDGHDIRKVELNSLRRQMSVMMQDSFIFSGTIMDNIRYGKLDASDEEVMAAAKAVHVHDVIMQMEKGYGTEVNERGSRLSVGQRQLISFARALLNDPAILILDEATSSIDTKTELLIQQALETLLKGRTSFVIAHRLSTIRKADLIMVVQDGDIIERGTHEELLAAKGEYFRLCDAQYRFLYS